MVVENVERRIRRTSGSGPGVGEAEKTAEGETWRTDSPQAVKACSSSDQRPVRDFCRPTSGWVGPTESHWQYKRGRCERREDDRRWVTYL